MSGGGRTPTRRMMSVAGAACSLFFVVVWLLPITYVGSAGHDIRCLDGDLRHMHRVACLFPAEAKWWGTYHIEVQTGPGEPWVELPLDGYFDMSIFGYRTRFHRLVGKSYRRPGAKARNVYLARWIAQRRRAREPDAAPLWGMRFVAAYAPVSALRRETGRYRKPALAAVAEEWRHVLAEFDGVELYAPVEGIPD